MLVGGRWSGWSRAWAHTAAYARSYFMIGLMTAILGPAVLFMILSMVVVLPGALAANLVFVRLFPKRSWVREPRRAWMAAMAGVPLVGIGSLAWLVVGGDEPPEFVGRMGPWGTAAYVLGIPVFLSNLGVLIGYLIPRAIPPSGPAAAIPPLLWCERTSKKWRRSKEGP